MRRLTLVLVTLAASLLHAATPADLAVSHLLLRSDARLSEAAVWRRVALDDEMDLVLALATPKQWPFEEPRDWVWWGLQRKLGLFLQDRAQPGRVYTLTTADGIDDCAARILRATATDTVISCEAEKSETHPNQKFVYDVRARRLVSRFAYQPFREYRVARVRDDGAVFAAETERYGVRVDFSAGRIPEFRIAAKTERPGWADGQRYANAPGFPTTSRPFGPSGAFRLAAVGSPECEGEEVLVVETRGVRERRFRLPPSADAQIGPWEIQGDTLWFGRTFYGGEGCTGTGGFGYFDAATREYRLFSPPELKNYSVSAIHVRQDAVWLALESRAEYGASGEGLARYDRTSMTIRIFATGDDVGRAFVSVAGRLLLATQGGVIDIGEDRLTAYFVDQTTDGRLRIAEASR